MPKLFKNFQLYAFFILFKKLEKFILPGNISVPVSIPYVIVIRDRLGRSHTKLDFLSVGHIINEYQKFENLIQGFS